MTVIAIYPTNYTTLRPGELRHYILRKGCASRNALIREVGKTRDGRTFVTVKMGKTRDGAFRDIYVTDR